MSSLQQAKVAEENPDYCAGCFLLAVLTSGGIQPPKCSRGVLCSVLPGAVELKGADLGRAWEMILKVKG